MPPPRYEFGRFTLEPDEQRLLHDGVPVSITPKAFDILVALVRRAPRLVSKDQLLKEVWPDAFVEEANLPVHISALRRALNEGVEGERYIETVPRRGYRFVAPVRADAEAEATLPEPLATATEPGADTSQVPAFADSLAGTAAASTEALIPVVEPSDLVRAPGSGVNPAPAARRRYRTLIVVAAAAVIIVSVMVLRSSLLRSNDFAWDRIATEGRLSRVLSSEPTIAAPALSPDGVMLAFVATDAQGQSDLHVTRIGGGEGQLRLTNDSAFEQYPRFSPDGSQVLFTRLDPTSLASQLCVVSALGGTARVIGNGAFGVWAPGGDRIAYIGNVQPDGPPALFTSALDGSDAKEIMPPSAAYQFLRHPAWSRDGNTIAVVRGTGGVAGEIWLVPAKGGEARRLTEPRSEVWSDMPVFTPDGLGIIYTSNRGGAANLWLQMFDGSRAIRLTTGPGPEAFPTVSEGGLIAFQSSRQQDELIVHLPSTSQTQSLLKHAPFIWAPVFSPDGSEVTFSRSETDGSWHLWRLPLDGSATATQVTSGAQGELHPRYTPDGRSIVFHSWGTPRHIWRVPREGGRPVQLTFGDSEDGFADVSPDGQWLAFARTAGVERVHLAPSGGGDARPLIDRPSSTPRWSPDGKLIAFSPTRGHNGGILVVAPDGTGERRLTDVGGWPVWWPDGKQISYTRIGPNRNQQIWTVSVDGGAPRLLDTLIFTGNNFPFDISRDAKRLVTSRADTVLREIWLLRAPSS